MARVVDLDEEGARHLGLHEPHRLDREENVVDARQEEDRVAVAAEIGSRTRVEAAGQVVAAGGVEARDLTVERREIGRGASAEDALDLRQRGGLRPRRVHDRLDLAALDNPVQAVADRERGNTLGRAVCETDAGARTHRLADERGLRDVEMVEQRRQVFDEGIAPAPVEVARQAETAVIEGDNAVRARKRIDLAIPDRMIAADAVRKYDRRALPKRLPVYFGTRRRQHTAIHHDTPINLLSRTT